MTSKQRDILETAACLAALILLALAVMAPAWTSGKVPISTDYAFTLPPWRTSAPADLTEASAALSREETEQYYPGLLFLSDTVTRNDSLLWNPREGCGAPFLAAWRTRALSPFSILFRFFSMETALVLSALAKLMVAGICAFYAARRLGLQKPYALFVAITFELGSAAFLRTTAPTSDVLPWLPLLVLFAEQTATGHRSLWPFGSLVWALMLFGGDPETAVAAGLFVLLFTLLRSAIEGEGVAATAADFGCTAGALVVGAALSAIQILPYIEFIRHAASTGHQILPTAFRWTDAALLFFPRFLDTTASEPADFLAARVHALPLLHVGVVSATMVGLGLSLRRFIPVDVRARVEALAVAALVFTLTGVVLGRLPVFDRLAAEHYFVANALALGITGATAAQQWIHLNAKQCMAAVPHFLIVMGIGVLVAAVLVVGILFAGTPDVQPTLSGVLLAFVLLLAVLGLLTATLLKPISWVLGYGLAALAVLGLWPAFPGIVPFSPTERVFPETTLVSTFKRAEQRIVGSPVLAEWPLSGNGIPQLYTSNGLVLERHAAFLARLKDDPLLVRRAGSSTLFLTKEDIQGPFAGIRNSLVIATPEHVFDSGAILFHDSQAQPRARMAYVGRSFTGDSEPVRSDLPPLMEAEVAPNQPADPEARVTILPPAENARVRVDVQQRQPGVLVLADSWYPGWRVAVDGVEKQCFPVDIAFRGVALTEGEHHVEFVYAPLSLDLGMYISAGAGLLVIAGLAFVAYAQSLRRRSQD